MGRIIDGRRRRKKLNLPRVPPIRKTGGAHKVKKGAKPKHKPDNWDGDQYYDNFIDGNGR